MAQYCYQLTPCRPSLPFDASPEERAIIGKHFDYLKRHLAEGRIIFVGRCEDGTFGITVYEAESDAEAEEIMRGDPVIAAGVMSAAMYPFRVALMRSTQAYALS
jgi:uncharacterized protein YciI